MTEDGLDQVLQACAHAAIREWDLDVTSLTFVAARENAVFRVECGGGLAYALRIHRPGYHSLPELESEIEWTTALADVGIATPRPQWTCSGAAYALVPYGGDGDVRFVGLSEWIDGSQLAYVLGGDDKFSLYRDLGVLMARMHDHTSRWQPSGSFVRHRLDLEGLLGATPWWGPFWDLPELDEEQRAVIDATRARMERSLRELGTDKSVFGLIHADLLPLNVLVHQGRPYVIDFDDAAFGWHHYDIAVCLSEFDGEAWVAHKRVLLEGYRSVREFSTDAEGLLPMFHNLRLFQVLGWMHTRIDELIALTGGQRTRPELLAGRIARAVAAARSFLATAH